MTPHLMTTLAFMMEKPASVLKGSGHRPIEVGHEKKFAPSGSRQLSDVIEH